MHDSRIIPFRNMFCVDIKKTDFNISNIILNIILCEFIYYIHNPLKCASKWFFGLETQTLLNYRSNITSWLAI